MSRLTVPLIALVALALSGCQKKPAQDDAIEANVEVPTPEDSASPSPAPTASSTSAAAPVGSFDTGKATVSTVKLGAFPYLSLPTGYIAESADA